MESPAPRSPVHVNPDVASKPQRPRCILSRLAWARRPKNPTACSSKRFSIYFYDDYINGKVTELRKNLGAGCNYRSEKILFKEAIRIAGSRANRPYFDKYCSIISKIKSYNRQEHMEVSFYNLASIIGASEFELSHLNHIERLVSSIDSAYSHYGLFLLNRFISVRKYEFYREGCAMLLLPEAGGITSADVDAICRLVNVIVSKCDGTSEKSISMLAQFFTKKSFTLEIAPGLSDALSRFDGQQIPNYLEKLNSTVA